MIDKKQILLDSVKKLLALEGISEKDIVENLQSVGLTKEQAVELLAEAKAREKKPEPLPVTPKPAEGFKKAKKPRLEKFEQELVGPHQETQKEEMLEEIPEEEELISEVEEEVSAKEEPLPAMPAEKPRPVESKRVEPSAEFDHVDLTQLWQKGILTAVDAKLEEMRSLKREIDNVIDGKVSAAVGRESGKIKGFFDSQRELNTSRMSVLIKEKTQEFSETINAKLAELKQLNLAVKENSAKLEAKQQVGAELLNSINEKLSDLEKTKARLVSSMNAELINSKGKVDSFVQEAQKKLTDLDLRVTKTLELENKIAEGLLKDAENKISAIVDQKTSGIDRKINEKINELNSIQERVDPKKVEEKLMQSVRDANSRIESMISEKMQPLSLEIEAKINDLEMIQSRIDPKVMEQRILELEKRFQKDAEVLNQKMEDFKLFKDQFISMVEKNTAAFNKSIKEFNDERQKQAQLIDAKIKELENFEKNFAQEMGLLVDEMAKGPKEPQAQKKKKQ